MKSLLITLPKLLSLIVSLIATLLPLSSSALRLAIFNDIHLNTTYDYQCPYTSLCYDQGMYDFDSPPALLDTMLSDLKENYHTILKNVDAIIVQGDNVYHGLSSDNPATHNWPQMKQVK